MAQRLSFAAVSSRSTSASVRYSRLRTFAFGSRFGLTVRFTMRGVTNFRCDFFVGDKGPVEETCETMIFLWTVGVAPSCAHGRNPRRGFGCLPSSLAGLATRWVWQAIRF
jgi:hypothetical protein